MSTQFYQCPMHPEKISARPGLCPICSMALVVVAGHGHEQQAEQSRPLSPWEKFRLSMTMTMGMDHTGMTGREMARIMEEDIRTKFFFSLLLALPIVAYSPLGQKILGFDLPSPIPVLWLLLILTTPVFFYGGWLFLYSAFWALKRRTLDMSVLIAIGITAAYGFSIILTLLGSQESFYEAAAMLITFVLFGHWMEMKSRRGTTDALQALFNLVPPQARVERDGQEVLVATAEITVGDVIILKPGDKVPVDGQILDGETAIDESLITGESLPISKKAGDMVIGGSINQTGSVRFKATNVGSDTALAQIVKLVETAQNSKAPGQKLADQWAKYLVIVATGGGLLTFAYWYLVAGQPLLFALTFAISAVVIACPDALGLATPTAVAVGTGLGAKHNILIKDAPTLERVANIQTIIFDKTGTLTEGKPGVTDFRLMAEMENVQHHLHWKLPKEMTIKTYILSLVSSLEQKSQHPLSLAVLDFAKQAPVQNLPVTKFEAVAGQGIKGVVAGHRLAVGTRKFMEHEQVMRCAGLDTLVDGLVKRAKTVVFVGIDGKNVAIVAVADNLRKTARATVERLKALAIETVMISGDNTQTAQAVGRELGIDRVFAEVLPAEKAAYIKKLQGEGKFTAMVGDGVNDAPALAQADIGIAIGAGTDVAIETAQVVLMKSDPADILRAITLSKATVRKMKQNLFWASIYNLLAIPIAAGVLYPSYGIALRPEVAALLMSLSSIIVAVNAVSLKLIEKDFEPVP